MLIYLSFGHQDPLVKEGRKNSADQSSGMIRTSFGKKGSPRSKQHSGMQMRDMVSSFLNRNQAETGFFRCIPSNSSDIRASSISLKF